MLEERQMDAVIDTLMRVEVETVEALREAAGPRGADAVAAAVRMHQATRETLRAALVYNDYAAVEAPLERSFARLGIAIEREGETWRRLGRRAARALLEVADENIRREQGVYRDDVRLAAALDAPTPTRRAPGGEATMVLPQMPSRTDPAEAFASMPAPFPAQIPVPRAPAPAAHAAMPPAQPTPVEAPGHQATQEPAPVRATGRT